MGGGGLPSTRSRACSSGQWGPGPGSPHGGGLDESGQCCVCRGGMVWAGGSMVQREVTQEREAPGTETASEFPQGGGRRGDWRRWGRRCPGPRAAPAGFSPAHLVLPSLPSATLDSGLGCRASRLPTVSAAGGPRPFLVSLLRAKHPSLGEVVSSMVAPGLSTEDRGSNLIGEEKDTNLHWSGKWGQRPDVPRRKHVAGCGLIPPTRLSL